MTNSSSIRGRMGANIALTVKLMNQRYQRIKEIRTPCLSAHYAVPRLNLT